MLQSFLSKVPKQWNAYFIIDKLKQAGVTNHFGVSLSEDETEWEIKVLNTDSDILLGIINSYQVDYLAEILPKLKTEIATKRSNLLQNFVFNGLPLPLDEKTITRITGAIVLLDKDPTRTEINWDASGQLDFISISRDNMYILGVAAGSYIQDLFDYSKTLRIALDAATTADEALAIDINSGWPT